jgi:hypothetical protein
MTNNMPIHPTAVGYIPRTTSPKPTKKTGIARATGYTVVKSEVAYARAKQKKYRAQKLPEPNTQTHAVGFKEWVSTSLRMPGTNPTKTTTASILLKKLASDLW